MKFALVENFLDMKAAEEGLAKSSLVAYEKDLEQLADFVKKDFSKLTEKDIELFIASLKQKGISPTSVARKISAIRGFYKFLLSEKEIDCNPTVNIDNPKKRKHLPNFLTKAEVLDMINAAEASADPRHKRTATMLKIMYACGLRVSELVSLPENCINFGLKQITVKGKGQKERLVPIADEAIKAVLRWLDIRSKMVYEKNPKFLFPSTTALCGHLTRDAFFKNVKKLAVLSGIDETKVSPHTLRHSFATHLLNNDVDLRSVQKMLGHESIATTEIYTHILNEKLTKEVLTKHPLAKI